MPKINKAIQSPKQKNTGISDRNKTIMSSLISIVVGLLVGFILLFLFETFKTSSNYHIPFIAMGDFLAYPFKTSGSFFNILYQTAPLILVGLSVGFAFKAGLFNIGASGQFTLGAFFALYGAIVLNLPWWAALIVGMIAGAIWGFIPGLFKAIFNINEVITTIMLNWAGLYLVNLLILNTHMNIKLTNKVDPVWIHNASGILPDLGLKDLLNSPFINIGIFIAIGVAIVIYIVLEKTVFGYEIKACGRNKEASKYAGIKAKKTIVLTMVIAGALSGLAGGVVYLAGTIQLSVSPDLDLTGFNGIPVALLAFSNPLGIIVSSVFIGYMFVSGQAFQALYSPDMTGIFLSVIIYFSAFALVVGQMIDKFSKRRRGQSGKSGISDSSGPGDPGEEVPGDQLSIIKEVGD